MAHISYSSQSSQTQSQTSAKLLWFVLEEFHSPVIYKIAKSVPRVSREPAGRKSAAILEGVGSKIGSALCK